MLGFERPRKLLAEHVALEGEEGTWGCLELSVLSTMETLRQRKGPARHRPFAARRSEEIRDAMGAGEDACVSDRRSWCGMCQWNAGGNLKCRRLREKKMCIMSNT